MIVEIFKKGTNFRNFVDIYYNVNSITTNDNKFILVLENSPNAIFNADVYEMKVSY